jgi:hypothetical protein
MAKDWNIVFGEGIISALSTPAAKLVAGLNPCNEKDRIKFGRHIGILKSGVERLGQYLGRDPLEAGNISGDDDDDGEEGENIVVGSQPVKKALKKWSTPSNSDWQRQIAGALEKKQRFYLQWLALQRPLVMPSMITGNKTVYRLWNLLLSVVRSPSCFFMILTSRLPPGRKVQRSIRSRPPMQAINALPSSSPSNKPVRRQRA